MKKILLAFFALSCFHTTFGQTGQFKIRNDDFIQIGYTGYKALTFGSESNTPNNGKFAVEYDGDGFNIWKPWPTWNAGNYFFFIGDDGNAGIGMPSDWYYKLSVAGDCISYGYYTYSDERLKQNLVPIDGSLSKIMALKTYQYQYKPPVQDVLPDSISINKTKTYYKKYADSATHFGVLAQDMEKLYPSLVKKDKEGKLSVNYIELIPVLIQSLQEQNEKIRQLEADMQILKQKKP
jgi:hypothetical protein